MNEPLRDELVAMADDDQRVRAALAADGSLLDGYHPRMEAVHRRNAARLREIVEAHGQAAYLEDRIRMFEGRPQRYGTQLQIGEDGRPVPHLIEELDTVDDRRRAVGLRPLAEQMSRAASVGRPDPATRAKRERDYQRWLRSAGWRA